MKPFKNSTVLVTAISAGAILTAFSTGSASAATLAFYDFESGALPYSSTDSDAGTTASDLSLGAGVGYVIDTTVGFSNDPNESAEVPIQAPLSGNALTGRYTEDLNSGSESLSFALGADDYFSFTVTPTGGASIDLTSFAFDYYIAGGGATPGAYLLAETSGGTFDATDLIGGGDSFLAAGENANSYTMDLSGVGTITEATEFRLYMAATASTNWGFAYDNIALEGTTSVIPEPSAALLGGIGVLALLRRRR